MVSLAEINSYQPNPNVATGNPGVVLKDNGLVNNLMQVAQFKAQNDWLKYQSFLSSYKDFVKDVSKVQELQTLERDKPYLQRQAADIFEDISKDPRSFFGTGDPTKLAEIEGKLGKLRADATTSAQDNLFDLANRQFLAQNPSLNTDENKSIIDGFANKALGERQLYTLNLPTTFDYGAYRQGVLANATSPFAESEITDANKVPNAEGGYIRDFSGNKISRDTFLRGWNAGLYTQQDKYGHSITKAIKELYGQLPDDVKKYYDKNGGFERFFQEQGEREFDALKNGGAFDEGTGIITRIEKDELKANPNYLKEKELAIKNKAADALAAERYAKANLDKKKAAAVDQQFNPVQTFDELFKGKIQNTQTPNGNLIPRVNRQNISGELIKSLGIDPINSNGDYNLVPSNIKWNGNIVDENVIWDGFKNWSNSDQAKRIQAKKGSKPDVFDYIYSQPNTSFEVEVVGKVPPVYKTVNGIRTLQNPNEAGKIIRSNRLQSWINQRKELGVKGDKLLFGEDDQSTDANDVLNSDNSSGQN